MEPIVVVSDPDDIPTLTGPTESVASIPARTMSMRNVCQTGDEAS